MKTVKHILQQKPAVLIAVNQRTSVYEALEIMMEKNISALLVMENQTLQGIFTERDYARKIILKGKSSKDTPIADVMTATLLTVSQDSSINDCMNLMTHRHIRHLPVIEDGKVTGMISIGDLVKFIIEEQQQTIQQLESYINS